MGATIFAGLVCFLFFTLVSGVATFIVGLWLYVGCRPSGPWEHPFYIIVCICALGGGTRITWALLTLKGVI